MKLTRLVLYAVLGAVAFVVASVLFSIISTALSILWSILTVAATLAMLCGIGYALFVLYGLVSDDETSTALDAGSLGSLGGRDSEQSTSIEPTSRLDRVKQQYADGDISEAEMERMLEQEIDTAGSIGHELDSELESERS